MNLHSLLKERAAAGKPIKVGVIGAGKFSSMFLAQSRLVPGMVITGIADLDIHRAYKSLQRTHWPEGSAVTVRTAGEINDAAKGGKVGITESAMELIASDCEVILEITGNPEAGTKHATAAIEAGKHVIMVNVEADCLLGSALQKRAQRAGVVYAMAYGDQPALIMEQVDWARTIGMEVVCVGKGTRYQPEYHYSTPETVWGFYGFSEEQVATGDYNPQMFNSLKDFKPGEVLDGEGGYTVFGKLVRAEDSLKNGFLPLRLTGGAKMTRPVAKGQSLAYADVELDQSTLAYKLRKDVETGKS